MNFCFWPNNPSGKFEYENMSRNLAKILDTTPEFFEPTQLAKVTADFLHKNVFDSLDFCLLEERARIIREIGFVIQADYNSSFLTFMEKCDFEATRLVRKIAQEFTGFRDEAIYNGEQVFFYKRAQILVADIFGAMEDRKESKVVIKNLDQLTMFADYRVPQTLRHVKIFEYSSILADSIDSNQEFPYSSA